MKKKTAIWLPFIIAISIVLGICIGRFYHQASTIGSRIFAKQNKIETLLSIIQSQYVDTVNINKLVENAMPSSWPFPCRQNIPYVCASRHFLPCLTDK